jgi:hypothetical protein
MVVGFPFPVALPPAIKFVPCGDRLVVVHAAGMKFNSRGQRPRFERRTIRFHAASVRFNSRGQRPRNASPEFRFHAEGVKFNSTLSGSRGRFGSRSGGAATGY